MPSKARAIPSTAVSAAGSPASDAEDIARIARALGHPARIHIVRLLLDRPVCIGCDIVEDVGLAQSTVSEHLRILKAAGIVVGEISRPRVCYSLNPESLRPLTVLLDAVVCQGAGGR
jgi:ArsR family transcriptional regulator